ncbi:hypothetical protein CHS0354_003081 [Potamilus streckersoni]|uniref:Uncharacterized protein n=1 Tax=Potamilus streckersoni TaxID=2493646 RepID=A0AAE0VG10_9BIVA|nr:hypothetical protein CHS0354_003081 [Potamilus streckersoni]
MKASLFIAFVGLFETVDGWVNAYDGPFTFACPQHEFISHISSIHDNSKEDRIWDFRCSSLSTLNVNTEYFNTETCFWSDEIRSKIVLN